jgi:transposase
VQTVLPEAVLVCDPFHLVRGANTALDTVRRERQRVATSERGKGARRAGRTISKTRALPVPPYGLLTGRERLTRRGRQCLCELFQREPLIADAWGLKEAFRAIYRSRDRRQAEQQLERFLTGCRLAAIPSFDAFAEGIRLWRQELLASFDEPVTNGYAEGVITKIKVIKRRAHGLPTFEGFRRRVLVACA